MSNLRYKHKSLRELRLYPPTGQPLTLDKLAARMWPRSNKMVLSKVELGTVSATPTMLARIAEAMRLDYDYVRDVYLRQVGGVRGWERMITRTRKFWEKYRPPTAERRVVKRTVRTAKIRDKLRAANAAVKVVARPRKKSLR